MGLHFRNQQFWCTYDTVPGWQELASFRQAQKMPSIQNIDFDDNFFFRQSWVRPKEVSFATLFRTISVQKISDLVFFLFLSFIRMDVCESKVEIVTPYWASNSNGKVKTRIYIWVLNLQKLFHMSSLFPPISIHCQRFEQKGCLRSHHCHHHHRHHHHDQVRAILNNKEFEQAVHQEICT